MELSKLSASKLEQELIKMGKVTSELCDKLIEAGRGYERISETISKTDELSLSYKAALSRESDARAEVTRRMEYHGSMKPNRQ